LWINQLTVVHLKTIVNPVFLYYMLNLNSGITYLKIVLNR